MNIVEIIKKAPKDHVYWCTLFGECKVEIDDTDNVYPITIRLKNDMYFITADGRYHIKYNSECVLFPSKDNRDWAAFERELDGKPEKNPLYIPESESFNGSFELTNTSDRPMMAAVIMSGLLAGGCKDSAGVLANKAVHYADIILKHTEEESNDKC